MSLSETLPILQLAIGPVIVISGVGLVLLSMTNRYGRVIDRARHLSEARRSPDPGVAARSSSQIPILVKRGRLLRLAIILASVSLLLTSLLVIALFLTALLQIAGAAIIVALFVASMAALIASLAVFICDINVSLRAVELELGVTTPTERESD